MNPEIPPSPPFIKRGEMSNPEPRTRYPLSEPLTPDPQPLTSALDWLDYCLGETAAAMAAVQEAALVELRASGAQVTPGHYHEICEVAAGIITLRGRVRQWLHGFPGTRFAVFEDVREEEP